MLIMVSFHRMSRVLKRRGIPAEDVDACNNVEELNKLIGIFPPEPIVEEVIEEVVEDGGE